MRCFLLILLGMKSALLFLVHFKIFLGLQSSIGVLQHLLDAVWILLCWLDFFFANWHWMFVLIALSFSADWLWISLPDWLLIHYLYCWWWFECIFFWISWRLVEVSSNIMIVQKVHWTWANSSIIHKIVCIQRLSLILIFHDSHLFVIRKVRGIVNHLMLRANFYQVKSWLSHLNLGRIC